LGQHEVDIDSIWQAVRHVIAKAALSVKNSGNPLKTLCVSSFGETCAAYDKYDNQAIPSFLYTDSRGSDEVKELNDIMGSRLIFGISGHKPGYMYTLPKLMWARNHMPHEFETIKKILPISSAVIYLLTGETVTDPSLASRTMMFDIKARKWHTLLLEQAGVDISQMPEPVDIGAIVGVVTKNVAVELCVPEDLKIIIGAHDQIVASIGSGGLSSGQTVNGSGSVECITPLFTEVPVSDVYYNSNFSIVPMLPGLYVTYAFIFSGGTLLDWFREKICAGRLTFEELDVLPTRQPTGILTLPHFAGAATPAMDNDAKGAILGLTLEHTPADVYRALQEGLCYESLLNIQLLRESGITIDSLKITGGGAKSVVWNQMKADVYGIPCKTLVNKEAGATGSAMLAGVASGVYGSLREAASILITEGQTFTPRSGMTAKYNKLFEKYKKIYTTVKGILN
jgi:xylulokinase